MTSRHASKLKTSPTQRIPNSQVSSNSVSVMGLWFGVKVGAKTRYAVKDRKLKQFCARTREVSGTAANRDKNRHIRKTVTLNWIFHKQIYSKHCTKLW